ncbi:MAG: TIGR04219 family outer membrane beta-barrel protein [Pseudomonadota bacterium]|nr:TIGR04219 family outer membrane beta-barrel protein [Pseudomonadota bacterium]
MQHVSRHVIGAALIGLISLPAQADFVGVYGGIDYWYADGSTEIAQTDTTQQTFNQDNKGLVSATLSVEHPVPLLPNARLRHVQLKRDDNAQSNGFQFSNQAFIGNTNLDLDMTNTDLLAYYEILDNIISVDVGLGATLLNGDMTVRSNEIALNSQTINIKETLLVAYASVGGSLPFTGFSAKAEAVVGRNQDARSSDLQAEIKYDLIDNLLVDAGVKAGYRLLKIELEDVKNTDATFDFKGPYLGLEIHF